jgi:IS5 family transposase
VEQLPQSGHVALDSTFFDRGQASAYYRTRSDRSVEALKVTTLTDTESLAVLDVQCYAQWRHDTKAGPQVVRWNTDDLRAVLADNAFQDWHSEYEHHVLDVEPLIHYRGSSLNAVGHNAVIRECNYTRRWMAECGLNSHFTGYWLFPNGVIHLETLYSISDRSRKGNDNICNN